MGIYDREYYRREGPGFLSFAGHGLVCKWLILINVACFVIQLATESRRPMGFVGVDDQGIPIVVPKQGWFTDTLMLKTREVLQHGQVWRLLTYAFLHDPGSLWHIVFNMLFLWWFGKDMEDLYGSREFLAFYLVSAFLGGCAFVAFADGNCIGASGAVTAVMVLFAFHYPTHVIYLWFLIPIPIWLFVGFQVLQDLIIFTGQIKTQTAVTVHLAGAGFGFLYYKFQWRLITLGTRVRSWFQERSRPRLRVYREEDVSRPAPVTAPLSGDFDEHLEAKLDAVLEKVARFGKDSLTEPERQILLRASEVYKKRRS
jgi:membrane associated rhomboid family serine protease